MYLLKNKKETNQEAEPYDDKEHLIARLWGTHLPDYMLIIADRFNKENLVCDFKEHGEGLWLSAFGSETVKTLYDDALPFGEADLDKLMEFISELEQK